MPSSYAGCEDTAKNPNHDRLKALVVINPEPEARRKVIQIMSSALDRSAVIVELNTLEEFAAYLPMSAVEAVPPDLATGLVELRQQLRRLSVRLTRFGAAQASLEGEQADAKSIMEELESRIDDLEYSDAAGDLVRLQSEVRDLDARIDSIVP